jgi:hypothetical protein
MGRSFSNQYDKREYEREQSARLLAQTIAEREKRMKLADKITMVLVDRINQVVVRPGPDPEERECYDMAQEIRDISPDLAALVEKILKVSETEEGG